MKGAVEGSSEITFVPGVKRNAAISLDMGTAASITLVLQAVIPAVALTGSALALDLVGGTDVPWSPTLDYFQRVVREGFGVIGISFTVEASRRGYYPRGGGRVSARVEPAHSVRSLEMVERPPVIEARLVSRCAGLPRHVAERQLSSASEVLERGGIRVAGCELKVEESSSPGSSVLAYSFGRGWLLGGDGIGARGRTAEEVGEHAAVKFVDACRSGACMDSNVADMLVPLLAMAPKKSQVRVHSISGHLNSGLQLAGQFTSCDWSVEGEGASFIVSVSPIESR